MKRKQLLGLLFMAATIFTACSNKTENKTENKVEKLQEDLKVAIKEERYEDAAKIRDEIKKMSK